MARKAAGMLALPAALVLCGCGPQEGGKRALSLCFRQNPAAPIFVIEPGAVPWYDTIKRAPNLRGEAGEAEDQVTDLKQLFSEAPYIAGERIVLKRIGPEDLPGLRELVDREKVYRYLPTFLFEKKYEDLSCVAERLYEAECLRESFFLGVYDRGAFCGIAELYGYRAPVHKISVGCRLMESAWGKGIASEAVELLVAYLYRETDIEIITASSMVENAASANVLRKTGFELVASGVDEDWGYDRPTAVDKWIR